MRIIRIPVGVVENGVMWKTRVTMGGVAGDGRRGFAFPFPVVNPELLLVPPAGGAATGNRPPLPEPPGHRTTDNPEGSFPFQKSRNGSRGYQAQGL